MVDAAENIAISVGCSQITFSAVCRHMCKVFWYPKFDKVSFLRLWQLPLFPDAHANTLVMDRRDEGS